MILSNFQIFTLVRKKHCTIFIHSDLKCPFMKLSINKSIRLLKTYHFADDTSILRSNLWLERLTKQVNKDLSKLSNWLRANRLSLNVKKTELATLDKEN